MYRWAIDANEEQIETYYKICNGNIIQVVEFDQNNAFPIVADPTFSNIVFTRTFTKSYCNTLYNKATKCSGSKAFAKYAISQGVSYGLAKLATLVGTMSGLAGVVGQITGIAMVINDTWGKYTIFVIAVNSGARYNGIKIMGFASGDISYTVIRK